MSAQSARFYRTVAARRSMVTACELDREVREALRSPVPFPPCKDTRPVVFVSQRGTQGQREAS